MGGYDEIFIKCMFFRMEMVGKHVGVDLFNMMLQNMEQKKVCVI